MKNLFIAFAIGCLPAISFAKGFNQQNQLYILENQGQIKDQNGMKRPDVHFSLSSEQMNAYIGSGEIHYQFYDNGQSSNFISKVTPRSSLTTIYRLDVKLKGANKNSSFRKLEKQNYHHNYQASNGDIIVAHGYEKIIYEDVYPNIDWIILVKNGQLEYDFLVREGGDISDIQLEYDGSTQLKLNDDGSITAFTPFGSVTESAPISYENSGSVIPTTFRVNDNIVSFNTGRYSGPLTIDPAVKWSTYYGGNSSNEYSYGIAVDNSGFVYLGGTTSTTSSIGVIATSGSHQTAFAGGVNDAFIAKFDSNGVRQWATYWGGDSHENRCFIANDQFGNVFILTSSQSPGLATPGAHKETVEDSDAIIAKFNNSGVRIWSTYFGGDQVDAGTAIVCDDSANIYITGQTSSPNGISTPGVYQETQSPDDGLGDAFVAKLDSNGIVKWGTYYSGDSAEIIYSLALDTNNDIYVAGYTNSTINIASPGSHQDTYNSNFDLFLAKFNNQGQRIWGTYYGGEGYEKYAHVKCDSNNNVYLCGPTNSQNGISTTGSWQPIYGGGNFDFLLAKFDGNGVREWGTYYGGTDDESPNFIWGSGALDCDKYGNCIIGGLTLSTNAIASPDAFQLIPGGGGDAFLAGFNADGNRQWGTYYGGSAMDACMVIKMTADSGFYIAGATASPNNISTIGSHQPSYGGSFSDAFLTKFKACDQLQISLTETDTTLEVQYDFDNYQWYYNGTAIPGANDSVYAFTQDGSYYAILRDSSGCVYISDTIIATVSANDVRANTAKLNVYPNPSNSSIDIQFQGIGAFEGNVSIIDDLGRIVLTEQCKGMNGKLDEPIDIGNSAEGHYTLRLNIKDKNYLASFVKTNK